MIDKIKGLSTVITPALLVVILIGLMYKIYTLENTVLNLNAKMARIESSMSLNNLVLPDNFKPVFSQFKSFNKDVDTTTVIAFLKVCNHYGFNNRPTIDYMIGQILTESGARHYGEDGNVIVGVSGAIGLCQIQVTTGYNYLSKKVKNRSELHLLGCTDFSFIDNDTLTVDQKKYLVKQWLSNVNNNLVLWGFIMHDTMKHRTVEESMIIYNIGLGGYKSWVDSGYHIDDHTYLSRVKGAMGKNKVG